MLNVNLNGDGVPFLPSICGQGFAKGRLASAIVKVAVTGSVVLSAVSSEAFDSSAREQSNVRQQASAAAASSGSSAGIGDSANQAKSGFDAGKAMGLVGAAMLGKQSYTAYTTGTAASTASANATSLGNSSISEAKYQFALSESLLEQAASNASNPAVAGPLKLSSKEAFNAGLTAEKIGNDALATAAEKSSEALWAYGESAMWGTMSLLTMVETFKQQEGANDAERTRCAVSENCTPNITNPNWDDPSKNFDAMGPNNRDLKDLKNTIANMKRQGIVIDPKLKKVVANGKVVESMADVVKAAEGAAGGKLPQDKLDSLMADIKKTVDKIGLDQTKKANPANGDGVDDPAGGSLAGLGRSGLNTDLKGKGLGGFKGGLGRDVASAKGLTKMFNGEPIGVAADSIFEMMNRRYQLLDKYDAFLGKPVTK